MLRECVRDNRYLLTLDKPMEKGNLIIEIIGVGPRSDYSELLTGRE